MLALESQPSLKWNPDSQQALERAVFDAKRGWTLRGTAAI
jgi:hypothetical protein